MQSLREIARTRPVIFPAHPRTAAKLADNGIATGGIQMLGPVAYEQMLALVMRSVAVVTDSGGIQEETTVLGIPCLTLRDNTERPVTITEGTNQLVLDMAKIPALIADLEKSPPTRKAPEGWDGQAGPRVIEALLVA